MIESEIICTFLNDNGVADVGSVRKKEYEHSRLLNNLRMAIHPLYAFHRYHIQYANLDALRGSGQSRFLVSRYQQITFRTLVRGYIV